MKTPVRIIASLVGLAILFLSSATLYSTLKGYTTWYFRVNGQVSVDGHKTTGYLHANTKRTLLLVTRTDGGRPETYLVTLRDRRPIFNCGEWHPARFLPLAIGDLSTICSGFNADPATVSDPPVGATLVLEPKSVEFSTASGKKVKAQW